jgi:hypothetical protein
MPDTEGVKISLLPSATTPADADVLAGVQGNTTKKFSLSALKTFFLGAVTPESIGAVPDTRTVNGKALSSNITLDASDVGAAEPTQVGSITLSSSWSGAGPYYQTVTVTGATVTANSKVDIQLTAAQISSLIFAGVTGLLIENNNGTLTAWAVGASPSAMTVQCTVEETA